MAQHTFNTLMRRLADAGFPRDFARAAVLPDWWEAECARDPDLLPDIELRVARFIRAPLSVVRDPAAALVAPGVPGARLRRVRTARPDRLAPAVYTGLQIAAAAVRCLREPAPGLRVPPADAKAWRKEVPLNKMAVDLKGVVADLWARGIPVLHVEVLPTPSYQGMACVVEGRPVVLIGHGYDDPARLAFFIGHEAGHVANADCAVEQPVVDDQNDIPDADPIEKRADQYSADLLLGDADVPPNDTLDFRSLAAVCALAGKPHGADPAALAWAWAERTKEFQTASMAVQALYRARGGKRILRELVDENLNLGDAAESDRSLLRCLYGDPERNATSG